MSGEGKKKRASKETATENLANEKAENTGPIENQTDRTGPRKTRRRKKAQEEPLFRISWPLKLLSFLLPFLLVPAAAAFITYYHFAQDLPSIDALKNYQPKTVTYLYADDGTVIGEFYTEYRQVVPLSKIPRHVILAFVAAEDSNFYNHPGIDLLGIIRAFIKNIKAHRIVQGGSTITQQVTRSFLLTNEKTFERKIREAMLAYRLEQNLTKDQILHLYLNQIYLGRGAYGVEAAALRYFDKHVGELTLAEAALLAGLVQAPARYSPFQNPELARTRQMYVINRMMEAGFINLADAVAALKEEIRFARLKPNPYWEQAPYYAEHVRQLAIALVGEDRFLNDGLRIYTAVNLKAQDMAARAIKKGLEALTKRQGYPGPRRLLAKSEQAGFLARQAQKMALAPLAPGAEVEALVTNVVSGHTRLEVAVGTETGYLDHAAVAWALRGRSVGGVFSPGHVVLVQALEKDEKGVWKFDLVPDPDAQAAFVCMENATGEVKAMIGGRDFQESQFNRAVQAQRQPGSAFKPFVYSAALDNGFTQASIIIDYPVQYKVPEGLWSPRNYGRGHSGPVTVYQALVRSINVVAVRVLEKVGAEKVIEYAHKMGIKSELGPYLSLALGACEVNLMEMVAAFTTFPNQGERVEPMFITRIEDRDNKVITEFRPKKVRALSPETAYLMLHMMSGVVRAGTGRAVSVLKHPVAGKTGTTNDLADAWFVGYTADYAAGAWLGRDVRIPLGPGEQGGRTAAPIFRDFMLEFLEDKPVHGFSKPLGIVTSRVGNTSLNEDGEIEEVSAVLAFRKGEVGPGRYSEHFLPPEEEEGEEGATGGTKLTREERMRRHIERYLTKTQAAVTTTTPVEPPKKNN
ncbi:MAG: PBP1A family penicillin-binding protein [Thermodesulfobacteriota bacterium]